MIKILKYGEVSNSEIFARAETISKVEGIVSDIIADVRARGDAALLEYTERFDGARLEKLRVSEQEIEEAYKKVNKFKPKKYTPNNSKIIKLVEDFIEIC